MNKNKLTYYAIIISIIATLLSVILAGTICSYKFQESSTRKSVTLFNPIETKNWACESYEIAEAMEHVAFSTYRNLNITNYPLNESFIYTSEILPNVNTKYPYILYYNVTVVFN
jgi:uncharacterized membrane protein YraQ (UPF0718 family)